MMGARFAIIRKGGKVVGFELMGEGEDEAGFFCFSFPFAQARGLAHIVIDGSKIFFVHGGFVGTASDRESIFLYSTGGVLGFNIEEEDAEKLDLLLRRRGEYAGSMLLVKPTYANEKGFRLIAQNGFLH